MTALVTLFIVLGLSFLLTRLATVALVLTGVSKSLARLQAVSAFTGVGFTTRESESIVDHPVRRRILILLMIVGNAGIVTSISSLILSFAGIQDREEGIARALWLLGGVAALALIASSRLVERYLSAVMTWALDRWTALEALDYASLLKLTDEYSVREYEVEAGDWVEGRDLQELRLFEEGVTVLGIHRGDGEYVAVPRGETEIRAGDRLVLYGRDEGMGELDERARGAAGDQAHEAAVAEQERERAEQQARDEAGPR